MYGNGGGQWEGTPPPDPLFFEKMVELIERVAGPLVTTTFLHWFWLLTLQAATLTNTATLVLVIPLC